GIRDRNVTGVQTCALPIFIYPQNNLSYTENFMRMMFAVPAEEYKPNPVLVRALDRIFILHADHEQNASTSTVRLAGSSGANPFEIGRASCRERVDVLPRAG